MRQKTCPLRVSINSCADDRPHVILAWSRRFGWRRGPRAHAKAGAQRPRNRGRAARGVRVRLRAVNRSSIEVRRVELIIFHCTRVFNVAARLAKHRTHHRHGPWHRGAPAATLFAATATSHTAVGTRDKGHAAVGRCANRADATATRRAAPQGRLESVRHARSANGPCDGLAKGTRAIAAG